LHALKRLAFKRLFGAIQRIGFLRKSLLGHANGSHGFKA
jgi:hypothetical protein